MGTMSQEHSLLLIDSDPDFRATAVETLESMSYRVTQTGYLKEGLRLLEKETPDLVLLQMNISGGAGMKPLERIREINRQVPVLLIMARGWVLDVEDVEASERVDFLEKPVNIDELAARMRRLIHGDETQGAAEHSIAELMLPATLYTTVRYDATVSDMVDHLRHTYFESSGMEFRSRFRSAIVVDDKGAFRGMIHFSDLLKLLHPWYLEDSDHSGLFTGMFLAQCRSIADRSVREIMEEPVTIDVDAPLIEAVHLMVEHHLINLPVLQNEKLVGIIREKDIVLEIANNLGMMRDD